MREFNTSGVSNPAIHYYVPRRGLLEKTAAQIRGKEVAPGDFQGRYFTLYAPRQMGKSTFVEALKRELEGDFLFLSISFESMIDLEEAEFCQELTKDLRRELSLAGIQWIKTPALRKIVQLKDFFADMRGITSRRLVLAIDEFDGVSGDYLGKLLHVFREIYHKRGSVYNLHSLILIGVRNLTEINLEHASPFNIADEIKLERFTREEVFDLMGQYEEETEQLFAQEVKERVYTETSGQPGLVNELCKLLVERFNPVDPGKLERHEVKPVTIGMEDFTRMLDYYITSYISKNVSNIINKARQDEEHILRLFNTSTKAAYMIDEPWQKYLEVNGIIEPEEDPESGQKYVRFTCPVYQKKLYAYFKPKLNPEEKHYLLPGEDYRHYLRSDGRLDLVAVLKNYQRYVNRRGSKAFSFARPRQDGTRVEAVYHYSLDCYLASMATMFDGRTDVEFPTGNGKVDIVVTVGKERHLVEVKNYTNEYALNEAKLQTARYARSEGLTEAYLVVFTEVHDPTANALEFIEEIGGVRLYGVLINVAFR